MKRDITESNDNLLVYRERASYRIGLTAMILGVSVCCGVVIEVVRAWPSLTILAMVGGFVGLILLKGGIASLIEKRLVADRKLRQLNLDTRFLFWHVTQRHSLETIHSISWKPIHDGDRCDYVIELVAPSKTVSISQVTTLESAREITRGIGEFLKVHQNHWDTTALGLMNQPKTSPNRVYDRMMTCVGRRPMQCIFRSNEKIVYAQSFEWTLIAFGLVMGPMGILFLLSPWLGIKINGLEGVPWGPTLIGGLLLVLALVFILGKRGLTINKLEPSACTWWGVAVPIRTKCCGLVEVSAVGWEKFVEESGSGPRVVCRAYLVESNGKTFTLLRSMNAQDVNSIGHEIAEFLELPIIQQPPINSSQKNSGSH